MTNSSKLIFKEMIVPILMLLISTLAVVKYYPLLILMDNTDKLISFINLLPSLPYILFLGCLLLAIRSNNQQFFFTILMAIFTYYILQTHNLSKIQSNDVTFYYYDLMLILIPINLIFLSTRKKAIRSLNTIFTGIVLVLEFSIYLLIAKHNIMLTSVFFSNLREEFPAIANIVSHFLSKITLYFTPDYLYQGFYISILALVSIILSFFIIVLKLFREFRHFFIGNIFFILFLIISIILRNYLHASMIFFSFFAFSLIILSIESNFSLAYLDELTSIPTRRKLNETMQNLGNTYTIAMIDVDEFKQINDKYGHRAGDQALQMIATKLQEMGGGSKVFRFAGDEFTAIFPGKESDEVEQYLEKFRSSICDFEFIVRDKNRKKNTSSNRSKNIKDKNKSLKITVSIGAANRDKKSSTPEKVLKQADKMLYKSKKAGRNKVSR